MRERRTALRSAISSLGGTADQRAVLGFSTYKANRVVDILLVAAYARLGGMWAEPSDLRTAVDLSLIHI